MNRCTGPGQSQDQDTGSAKNAKGAKQDMQRSIQTLFLRPWRPLRTAFLIDQVPGPFDNVNRVPTP